MPDQAVTLDPLWKILDQGDKYGIATLCVPASELASSFGSKLHLRFISKKIVDPIYLHCTFTFITNSQIFQHICHKFSVMLLLSEEIRP